MGKPLVTPVAMRPAVVAAARRPGYGTREDWDFVLCESSRKVRALWPCLYWLGVPPTFVVFSPEFWQVVPAAIAAAVAIWQFAGLKDHRRAEELVQLERAIVSAAERKDPLEHAYRAHAMKRLQVFHGNRAAAGVYAFACGIVAILFLIMAGISKGASLLGQTIIFLGLTISMLLAARNWALWLYSTRTLHNETGEAYELAMVAARESFIDSSKHLPPLRPVPDLVNETVANWKKAVAKKRSDIILVLLMLGVVAAYVWSADYAVHARWLDLMTILTWTFTATGAGLSTLLVGSRRLAIFTANFSPIWWGRTIYWLSQVAWVAGTLMFVPGWLKGLVIWTAQSSHPQPSLEEFLIMPGSAFASGVVVAGGVISLRLKRWRKRHRQSLLPGA